MILATDTAMVSAIIVAIIVSILAPMVAGWSKGQTEKSAKQRAAEEAKVQRDQEATDRRAEKEQDWARQDLVAERALKAQREVAQQAADAARLLLERQDQAADAAALAAKDLMASQQALLQSSDSRAGITEALAHAIGQTDQSLTGQLRVIHALVNSNMTTAIQAELDAKRGLLLALERNAALEDPSEYVTDLIAATTAKIAELEVTLAARAQQQSRIDRQAALHAPIQETLQ